jgi:DNA-directed RNA polymerase specialized sigma24 family protein
MFPSAPSSDRTCSGDEAAAVELVARYSTGLLSLARSQMPRRYWPRFCPEDVVQSVYRTFFSRCRDKRLDVPCGADLWGLLAVITLRKCHNRREHARAARRDVRREAGSGDRLVSREADPADLARLADLIDAILATFPESVRPILEATLRGETAEAISLAASCPVRTVRRVRQRFRERLDEELIGA